MEKSKCIECEAYGGHSPNCSLMSGDYAKSALKRYYEAWLDIEKQNRKMFDMYNNMAQLKINRIKKERDQWKGKFFTVKEENNSLRKNNKKNR